MSAGASQEITLGSRGSDLARAQTAMAIAALRAVWPDLRIRTQIIQTRGDARQAEALDPRAGRKGLFTGEIEKALAAGEIDVAVHSAKDLPSDAMPGLELSAVLRRAPVEDILISKKSSESLLRAGATIATGSVRRQHQLRWIQPDIEVIDLRGNVPTRLRKFVRSDWDAIMLARAGLERLGYELSGGAFVFEETSLWVHPLSSDDFVPAGGQGIIAMQVRSDDEKAKRIVQSVNDAETFFCLRGEREFLRLLQGDCDSPVGVLATIAGSAMTLRAQVFEPPHVEPRMARVEDNAASVTELARELWKAIDG
jgi:hydroxymethylbilane synthase